MKRRTKFFALLLSAVMTLGVCTAAACGEGAGSGNGGEKPGPGEQQQQPTPEVKSVAIKYGDSTVEGLLSANLTTGTMELIPVVTADAGAEYTLTWTSSEPDVATVSGDKTKATLTLNGPGETAIKADTGKKSAEFVLSVEDDRPKTQYTITVVDGVAKNADGETITKAEAGTQVTLEATTPAHKTFTEWTFDNKDVSLNGLSFTMPASNVTATANFTDILYPLSLVGAKVIKAGDGEAPEGKLEGYTDEAETAESKILSYQIAYDTEVTIQAAKAAANRIFVAWDYQIENNRVGDLGVDQYTFKMSDAESTKYTAIFSNFSPDVWLIDNATTVNNAGQTLWGQGAKTIRNGGGDEDLQGLTGYTLSIPGGTKASVAYPENIASMAGASSMDTREGRAMGKFIFKNHGTVPITLETYATYCGVLITSGNVTVKPGEVVVKYVTMSIGISNCWWGVQVREDVEGTGFNQVDMVLGIASTLYPNGDPYLIPGNDAEIITFGTEGKGQGWGMPNVYLSNAKTVFQMCGWGSRFESDDATRWYRLRIKKTILPEFDESNPKLTVYGRVINNMNHTNDETANYKAKYKVVLGTDESFPAQSSVEYEFTFTQAGQIATFKLEIDRESASQAIYLFIMKPTLESTADNYGYAIIAQFAFNNAFGYEEV